MRNHRDKVGETTTFPNGGEDDNVGSFTRRMVGRPTERWRSVTDSPTDLLLPPDHGVHG
jgi:hypothetical protein